MVEKLHDGGSGIINHLLYAWKFGSREIIQKEVHGCNTLRGPSDAHAESNEFGAIELFDYRFHPQVAAG